MLWRQKGVFLATFVEEDSVVEACEERLSFLLFPYVCPSLSWENDHF